MLRDDNAWRVALITAEYEDGKSTLGTCILLNRNIILTCRHIAKWSLVKKIYVTPYAKN